MATSTTILAMAPGSMPTRDIMEDTILVTTTEVTAMFLSSLSMVVSMVVDMVDITLTTGTSKNKKSL